MNFLDVHVNRAPIEGKIIFLKHIKGLFISLRKKEAIIKNERVLTVINNDSMMIGIVQIASRLVRKIVPYIKEGTFIQKGERIGLIRFGSQVDVIIPDLKNIQIKVIPKDKVKAGISIIASLDKR
jgi:phosphatidylserine decarboxylase